MKRIGEVAASEHRRVPDMPVEGLRFLCLTGVSLPSLVQQVVRGQTDVQHLQPVQRPNHCHRAMRLGKLA